MIPVWVLDGIVDAAREILKEREASPLIGVSPREQKLFTRTDRDTVWWHLTKSGICCARVDKTDNRPKAVSSPFIVVARGDAELAAELEDMQSLIVTNNLVGLVALTVIHDA